MLRRGHYVFGEQQDFTHMTHLIGLVTKIALEAGLSKRDINDIVAKALADDETSLHNASRKAESP